MAAHEWDKWVPGVLNKAQMQHLSSEKVIQNVHPDSFDNSSFDLHITKECWHVTGGTIKPCGERFSKYLNNIEFMKPHGPDDHDIFTLKFKNTYIFKLKEKLDIRDEPFYGQATAKSSIGRIDVLARLIVDGMHYYEGFDPSQCIHGDMYIEVTPITFGVNVKEGFSFSQLRLFKGNPDISEVSGKDYLKCVLKDTDGQSDSLSVDLSPDKIMGKQVMAFQAKTKEDKQLDLTNIDPKNDDTKLDPQEDWKIIESDERIFIKQKMFYILKSKEQLTVPGGIAVYCKAIDETIGEMRIHYAGFAHPWFGRERTDGKIGTPLIFEVRGHLLPVNLKDGEKLARLKFFRMSENQPEEQNKKSENEDPYKNQSLRLSKFYKTWPEK